MGKWRNTGLSDRNKSCPMRRGPRGSRMNAWQTLKGWGFGYLRQRLSWLTDGHNQVLYIVRSKDVWSCGHSYAEQGQVWSLPQAVVITDSCLPGDKTLQKSQYREIRKLGEWLITHLSLTVTQDLIWHRKKKLNKNVSLRSPALIIETCRYTSTWVNLDVSFRKYL